MMSIMLTAVEVEWHEVPPVFGESVQAVDASKLFQDTLAEAALKVALMAACVVGDISGHASCELVDFRLGLQAIGERLCGI